MGKLEGRVAIVTGAARGVGAAIAGLFVTEGAKVVLCDVSREQGEKTAAQIGDGAIFRHLDIREESGWSSLVDEVLGLYGKVDILVNTAAICNLWALEETDIEAARAMVDTNLFGALIGAKSVAKPMRAAGKGVIINFSSLTGVTGMNGLAAYAASKWAIRGLTRCLAFELGPEGIRVCTVVPGGVNTPMNNPAGHSSEALKGAYARTPLQRIGEPIELARATLFLVSDDASYITASDLIVDGGDSGGYYQASLAGAPPGFFAGRLE